MKLRNILLSFALLVAAGITVSLGHASWQYSGNVNTLDNINVNINAFTFDWVDSDVLDEKTYEYSSEFPDALNGLNDSDSVEGQALKKAIESKRSGADWVGNMDNKSTVITNLDKVLDVTDDCKYIIKIKSDGSYELYVTYESLNQSLYTRFGPVYKTVYQKDENGVYKAVQSYKGTATITYYDTWSGQWQRSFNTDDFRVS